MRIMAGSLQTIAWMISILPLVPKYLKMYNLIIISIASLQNIKIQEGKKYLHPQHHLQIIK